jgi:hypothetical protein
MADVFEIEMDTSVERKKMNQRLVDTTIGKERAKERRGQRSRRFEELNADD